MENEDIELFASCLAGLEAPLADELRRMGVRRVRPLAGGVAAFCDVRGALSACLWSRLASRVLAVVGRVDASDAERLHEGVRGLPWEDVLACGASIAVQTHGANDELRNTRFTALKVKDAVCDRMLGQTGRRPEVDPEEPDALIDVRVRGARATLSLDLSGGPLYRRTWLSADDGADAPLSCAQAAGLLALADWQRLCEAGAALVDPACGDGALVVEAAAWACDLAPGLVRERWGFFGWGKSEPEVWNDLVREADERFERGLARIAGADHLAFYDAAAPIVMADSLDGEKLFRQSRYEDASAGAGDYLNAPFTREEYDAFVEALVGAERVIQRDFETHDLFQACQPIEEIARKGHDAPRFGTLKPVGLTDPRTGRRPWAALQLRAEDAHGMSYNLVGFQTNLTFPEQRRVFRMIPGLENAEFARYGVMHRNTFLDAPRLLDADLRLRTPQAEALGAPVFVAGQLAGTEGYCEAIRSGLHAAISASAALAGVSAPPLPRATAFGALMAYATDPATVDYQPMHVNFGIMEPLERPVRNKRERYAAYAERGGEALEAYVEGLAEAGLLPRDARRGGADGR